MIIEWIVEEMWKIRVLERFGCFVGLKCFLSFYFLLVVLFKVVLIFLFELSILFLYRIFIMIFCFIVYVF